MYGLDTNVLIRYLLRDDPVQAEQARATIESAVQSGDTIVISLLTMLESEWVLRSCASLDKRAVITTFRMLLETRDIRIEQEETLEEALYQYENNNTDFADCIMATRYARLGCSAMLTFDKKASQLPGVVAISDI
jgi:predicted nucleic-acid-binding protein